MPFVLENACYILMSLAIILLIGLLLLGLKNPTIWRLLSALGMAIGAGLLVWGIIAGTRREELSIGSPSGIIGAGAGVLVGAISLFVVSFFGGRKPNGGGG
jgi:hypothetical protein